MNAFERLIDRSLFTGLGFPDSPPADGQEASSSWTLLQALLRQNEQARSYTQRLLLKKAREEPGLRPSSMERWQALTDLWPAAEREAVSSIFSEVHTSEGRSAANPALTETQPGMSTPPRRQSHTPDWGGPPFSESPALPGSRSQVPRHYGGLEDSAITVQIRGSRDQAVGDSATTLASKRQASSSLDAWLQPGDVNSQMRRTRSLPTSTLGAERGMPGMRSWAPQLVLDFGPSGSSEDDRARMAQQLRPQLQMPREEASQATKACGSCGSHLAPDANFCRKCGRPREDQGEACRSSARRGGSSSSGAEQSRRRAASVPQKRHSLPNAPSDSEDEVTLEPESLKPAARKKHSSRTSSKKTLQSEVRNDDSGDEKRRLLEEAAEKLEAKVSMTEAALADAEEKLTHALAETRASAKAKELAEAQAVDALAEAKVMAHAKEEAEAHAQASSDARAQAEARLATAIAEVRAAAEAREAAEAQSMAAMAEVKAFASAKDHAEAQAAAALAEAKALAKAKEGAEVQRQVALEEARASSEAKAAAEARASSVAAQAEVAVHARQAAEAKIKATSEALALAEQRLSVAVAAAGEAKATAEAWASEATEASKKAKLKDAAHQRLASICTEAQPRWLAQRLQSCGYNVLRWAFEHLVKNAIELRGEQRLGPAVASQAQSLHHENQLLLDSMRQQHEERLRQMASEHEQLLQRVADSITRELQLVSGLAEQRRLREAFAVWRWAPVRSQGARRILRVLKRHLQRRHLQIWRRQAEADLVSYLQVQIDCFESFASKRNALCWRVMRRSGGYWTAEQQDLTSLAVMAAWRGQVEEGRRCEAARSLACQKLIDVGFGLLRRHLWSPWLAWQQAEQRSLTMAMRQVEESHFRKEAAQLKQELEAMHLQASLQRDTFAAECSSLRNGRRLLEESSEAKALACASQRWISLGTSLRRAALQALLRPMRWAQAESARNQAARGSWRRLVQMVLAENPWRLRSCATHVALEKLQARRQQSVELIRQRRPMARLVAFALALRQREARRLASQAERCLRDLSTAWRRLGRLTQLAQRGLQRRGLHRLRTHTTGAWAAERQRERWEALLQGWNTTSALQNAGEAQKKTAAQFLLHMLSVHERCSCRAALQRWHGAAQLMHLEASHQPERMRLGLSILATLVSNKLQGSLSQAISQWRILRWQHMVRSLDDSVARDHRRMLAESEVLRSQLVQSRDEAQKALQSQQEAEAMMDAVKRDCLAQEAQIVDLERAKRSTHWLCEQWRERRGQAEMNRLCSHLHQVRTLEQRVLLSAWRSVCDAQAATQEQRTSAAHFLLHLLAAKERRARQRALQCWRGSAMATAVEASAQCRLMAHGETQRELRVCHGVSILSNMVRLRLQQALLGHWRVLRWQAMVRSLDSSFARDQRRMLAEADALRAQLVQSHDEALELRALQLSEAERSNRTRQEAEAIVEAVKRERASQATKMADLENDKSSSKQQCEKLQEQLEQALADVTQLDAEKRSAMKEISTLHSELQDAERAREDLVQAEMQRERALQEQVQAVQQRALKREAELKDAAQMSDQAQQQKILELHRSMELQTSMAEDQEKNIRHLQDLLKEQGEQLARERSDHQRGLNALRASASLSESKTSLLQEQVVALRQQLQREHQELMASERAWSSDRAALLSAVSSPVLPPSGKRAARRKPSPSSSPKPGGARCPWHGPGGSKKLAPALM